MTTWLGRVRGAVGMGLTWAVGWAVAGVMIGAASNVTPWLPWDSFFQVFDAPLTMLAIPGFIAGTLFSAVLGVAGRRRRFDELSLPRFAAWGALGGLLLSLVPVIVVITGLASAEGSRHGMWEITGAIAGPFILLSAASAAGSLLLARRAQRRDVIGDGTDDASALPAGEVPVPQRTTRVRQD